MSQRRISNHSASIRQRLLDRARSTGESYEDLLIKYGIERFLYRLGVSQYKDRFVLKGAILFQVWDRESARMTRDIDLLGYGDMSVDAVPRILRGTLSGQLDSKDGLVFDPESSQSVGLAKDTQYSGVRSIVHGDLGGARIAVHLDIGVGDAVDPTPRELDYPVLLDLPAPRIRAYPREVVIAEKVHAMVVLGMANSRLKDYYDVWLLSQRFSYDGSVLHRAMHGTFERRLTPVPSGTPPALSAAYSSTAARQSGWVTFARRARLPADERLPHLEEVVQQIASFVTPLFGQLPPGSWPVGGPWTEK